MAAVSMDRQDIPPGNLHEDMAQSRGAFSVYQPPGSHSPDQFILSFDLVAARNFFLVFLKKFV
jgi:hypothetical protein